jgi:tryptophan synthase beta chain
MKLTDYPVDGKYGKFGGRFVPEILMEAINELETAYEKMKKDPSFQKELDYYLAEFVGRPTPLYYAENLTKKIG